MCRLLYLPAGQSRPAVAAMTDWLEQLEKSAGGHGNGYATVNGGFVKGVGLSAADSAAAIAKMRRPVVWHTRRISCGLHTDELCHPFVTHKGCYLVHNGHWHQGAFTARCLKGPWSDTAVAALFIRLYGWEEFTKECSTGVWLHLTGAGLQVHYGSGDLVIERRTGALASEPSAKWGIWDDVEPGTYGVHERPKTVSKSINLFR